jgi:hypothetical protein
LGEGAEGSRAATPMNNHPYASMDDEQKDFYHRSMKLKLVPAKQNLRNTKQFLFTKTL